jgi:peroxiredoxin
MSKSLDPNSTLPQRAPALMGRDSDGSPVGIVPGKVNVLVFWATWTSSAPHMIGLQRLREIFARRAGRLTALVISVDEAGEGDAVARMWGMGFPVLRDADHRIVDLFGAMMAPLFYLIDQHGIVRSAGPADDEQLLDELESKIDSMLANEAK